MLFDDVQHTRRDWRNRNRIKTRARTRLADDPCEHTGPIPQPHQGHHGERRLVGRASLANARGELCQAPYFRQYAERFERLYLENQETHLSAINRRWLEALCEILGVRTRLSWSMDYDIVEGRTERLVSICQQAGADCYVSGPAAARVSGCRLLPLRRHRARASRLRRLSGVRPAVSAFRPLRQA
mgnify:CR=1 FL=1